MASAQDNVPAAKMEEYLTCSICLEILKDPRTLACSHSFCICCLAKFVKGQREKAEGKIIEEFNCPECRTVFQLKQGQHVEEMARNHFVLNMLDLLAIKQRPNEITCNKCDRKSPAASRCTTCEKYLCTECLTAHGKWFDSQTHTVFTIDELTKPENQAKIREKTRCKKHKNEIPQYYCETCKQLACIHCILLDHNKADGHSCVSTEEVAERKRELLKSSSGFLNNQLKEGNDLLQNIDHVTQELKNNAEKAKDEISQQQQNILKAFAEKLEEKAQLLKNEVDNKYNETNALLEKQNGDVKAYVNKVEGSVKLAKNLLENGSDEEMISLQNQIEENVKEVKSERPPIMKPVHDGDIQFKANPVNDVDTTSNLNKMGEVVISQPVSNDPKVLHVCKTFTSVVNDLKVLHVCKTSAILNGHNEYGKQVVKWLGGEFQWRLCYRASTHGWRAQDFHRTCDNKGPTVTLLKVEDYMFGGYTDQNWAGPGARKRSTASFLFSLKNKDNLPSFKSPVYQNHNQAIVSGPSWGPVFGGGNDLYVCNNPHTTAGSCTNFGKTYQPPAGYIYGSEQAKSLLAGSYNFTPTEIEVFY